MLRFFALWFFLLISTAGNAQEQCGEINSDVARLECFDNWYISQRQTTLSPTEAFEALSGLSTYTSDAETFFFEYDENNPCILRSTHIVSSDPFGVGNNIKVTVGIYLSETPLHAVERMDNIRRADIRFPQVTKLYHARNASGSSLHLKAEAPSRSLIPSQEIDLGFFSDNEVVYERSLREREIFFALGPRYYNTDKEKIFEAFKAMHSACRAS